MTGRTKVLVIEDDESIRNNVLLMLKVEHFNAQGAENGRIGVELARADAPDLIICDINMPEMDGFAVLDAVRAESTLADIPFIFLTALNDRGSMRRGMNLGADDYISKPFTRDELMDAVNSRLKRHEVTTQSAIARLVPPQDQLTQKFREKIRGGDPASALENASANADKTGKIAQATVLFSDIRNFTTYSERLSNSEIAEFLNTYLARACVPLIHCGGRIMQFIGDGIMALFEDDPGQSEPHALRALRAGLAMQIVAHGFREWVQSHHPSRNLPEFAIGVGVHSGEVLMCHVGAPDQNNLTAIGDTVNIASRLEGQTKKLGWAVAASDSTIAAAGTGISLGARQSIMLRGRSTPTETHEVLGIGAATTDDTPVQLPEGMREALAANARIAADAAKAALGMTLRMLTGDITGNLPRDISIQGYRILSKIGQGGSSVVYLAERENDRQTVVLKILNAPPGRDETLLKRFIQEFDLISTIDHPSVVKIYDRGFSDRHAYIAMEYFPGGSLADIIAKGLTPRQALSLAAQAAAALREIHRRGIVHRDIKPANLMARADGTIALVDFGIAKLIGQNMMRTRHGELYGTPYYVSPEQIRGEQATVRSDIYALGIMFYEMLTGKPPFDAPNVSELVAMHINAPRPWLPESLSDFQKLLDRMMAVDPAERFVSAEELLQGIDLVWTKQALRAMKDENQEKPE